MNQLNRRNFIRSSSGLVPSLGLGTWLSTPKVKPWKEVGIQIAIATIRLDGFGDEDFHPAFEIIPKTAIKNVEFNVWNTRNITASGIENIRSRCYRSGLTPISLQGTSFGGNVVKDVGHKL